MKNITRITFLLLTAAATSTMAYQAVAGDTYKAETTIERDDDGDATKNVEVEKTTDTGSKSYESETSVDVDDDGDAEKTVETKTVTDPKGLFNKETVKTTDTIKSEDGKISSEHEKEVNGDTVEESSTDE